MPSRTSHDTGPIPFTRPPVRTLMPTMRMKRRDEAVSRIFLNLHYLRMLGPPRIMSRVRRHLRPDSHLRGPPSNHRRWTRGLAAIPTVAPYPPVRSRTLTRCPLIHPRDRTCRRRLRVRCLFDLLHLDRQQRQRGVQAPRGRELLSWTRSQECFVPSGSRCSLLPIQLRPLIATQCQPARHRR